MGALAATVDAAARQPDLDYTVDCLELGERAALALVLRDQRFAARVFRQMILSVGYFAAAARARKENPR